VLLLIPGSTGHVEKTNDRDYEVEERYENGALVYRPEQDEY
jgi:hypothetical protein